MQSTNGCLTNGCLAKNMDAILSPLEMFKPHLRARVEQRHPRVAFGIKRIDLITLVTVT